MKHKILIIGCILAAISFSGCQSSDTNVNDNKQTNNYENVDSKKVSTTEVEKNKDDNKNKDENKSVKVEDKTKNKNTDVDLSEFDITCEKDEPSGVMFVPTKLNNSLQLRFKKFNGVHTMEKFNLEKEQSLKINYSCELESGKINVLILDSDYKVIKKLSANSEESFELKAQEEGQYIIKAVGDKAYKGKIVVDFQ